MQNIKQPCGFAIIPNTLKTRDFTPNRGIISGKVLLKMFGNNIHFNFDLLRVHCNATNKCDKNLRNDDVLIIIEKLGNPTFLYT